MPDTPPDPCSASSKQRKGSTMFNASGSILTEVAIPEDPLCIFLRSLPFMSGLENNKLINCYLMPKKTAFIKK